MDYKKAGVDIDKGEALAKRIAAKVRATYGERVRAGVGGFAGLYRQGDKLLAAGTDGVGTKVLLAQELGVHDTIGIDLVAMCINDIICTGAKPLFFMDYLAVGKLEPDTAEAIIDGIVSGCRQGQCALLGGETAEMPGVYAPQVYDLAGMAVGEVAPEDVLGGKKVQPGQSIIGLAASGFHSNGYSLLRQLVRDDEVKFKRQLLTPTRIYWPVIKDLLAIPGAISAAAHITGGGLDNIARVCHEVDYVLETLPSLEELPPPMPQLIERSKLPHKELCRTFNMGLGMALISERPEVVLSHLEKIGETHWVLGKTRPGSARVLI